MLLLIILVPLGFAALALVRFHSDARAKTTIITQPRSIGFFACTASLVASAAGVWILFGPAQAASWSGLYGLFGYALGQAAPFILIAIIGMRLLRTLPRGYTLPQWAEARYGPTAALWALLISIFYMSIFLAAELTAIGFAASLISDVPLPFTVAFIAFCTWIYTNRGGFGSVIWTDKIQFALLVPLLLLIFLATLFLLPDWSGENILPTQSLFPSFGLEFGIILFIAILAAQVFNQSIWQRAYACRSDRIMRTSFLSAGLLMIPIILVAGSFGLFALRLNLVSSTEETELFLVVMELAPQWILILLLLVALILVMSSIDSLLNALAETVSSFIIRPNQPTWLSAHLQRQDSTQRITRIITSLLALGAAVIAMQGYSVLYLFLVADLICAGTVVPLFYGLYNKRFTQGGMLLSSACGILCGALLMLAPSFQPLFPQIANPLLCFITGAEAGCENSPNLNLLMSFVSALVLSTAATIACALIKTTRPA